MSNVQTLPRWDSIYSQPAGSIATNYEIIGFRPGCDWAELLIIGDNFTVMRHGIQWDAEAVIVEWIGFKRIMVIQPGDKRPANVIQTPKTRIDFIGDVDSDSLVNRFLDGAGGRSFNELPCPEELAVFDAC